jgi:UDP-N-acetyl-D-galactosamine dehydrogenase
MGAYVAGQLVKAMLKRRIQVDGARVLVLGLTFKEDCPDIRNTRVLDLVSELEEYGVQVDVHDPWISCQQASDDYSLDLKTNPDAGVYGGVILAVAHNIYREMGSDKLRAFGQEGHVFFDLKSVFRCDESDLRL